MLYILPETVRTPVSFIVVLGVLVFVHELGHYFAARWAGIHAEVFSIGFGKALWQRMDRHGTVWKICWLPLGGYVKMHGQERPEDVSDEERAQWDPARTFHHKTLGRRAIVVAAGPLANFLLAAVLFTGLFYIAGKRIIEPVAISVAADSAAERAGLQIGDRITAIGDTPIGSFDDIRRVVSPRAGQALDVQITRASQPQTLHVTLGSQGSGPKAIGLLGISGKVEFIPQPAGTSLLEGIAECRRISAETLSAVGQMFTGQRGMSDLGGPLRIAQMSGEMAQYGPASLINFIAVISINLGLINLFPIPVLDGGHLLFYLAEAILGRPLPPIAVEYCFRAGFAVLVCLFVFATFNDVTHFGWFSWVARLIG